jgi:hyperosmotically inducible protein
MNTTEYRAMRAITKAHLSLFLAALLALGAAGCASDKPLPGVRVGSFVDDSYLTSAVKTKLLGDTGLKSFHIKVITDQQVVTLSGTVPTSALREQAVTVAKSVDGVKDVIDDIEVKAE